MFLFVSAVASAQANGEFLFTRADGSSFVRKLSPEWRPEFRDAFVYITPQDRVLALDLMAIQPFRPDTVPPGSETKAIFRTTTGTVLRRYFVLPSGTERISDLPVENGFHKLGPQTFVRQGSFTVELR